MTELTTLQNRIASLTHGIDAVSGHSRDLMPAGMTDPLAAMRLEIEETQLLRRLVFSNDKGETIGIEVASSRVLRVSETVSHLVPPVDTDLMGQDLFEDNQNQVMAVADLFLNFGAKTKALCVESHILEENKKSSSVGIPASKLFQLPPCTATTLEPRPDQTSFASFADRCAPIAIAMLGVDGDEVLIELGPDEFLRALRNIAGGDEAKVAGQPGSEKSGQRAASCVILSEHPNKGRSLLCAAASGHQVFILFETAALAKVLEFWRVSQT